VQCTAEISYDGEISQITGEGNGPIDAFVHAMKSHDWNSFSLIDFHEQAIGSGADTEAAAYIMIRTDAGDFWGAGRNTDSTAAGLFALVSAYNRSVSA
jgi:2-isopropylmalate synthase